MKKNKAKKPFYKKWWVWLIGILVIVGIVVPKDGVEDVPEKPELLEEVEEEPEVVEREETVEEEPEQPPEEPVEEAPIEEPPVEDIPIADVNEDEPVEIVAPVEESPVEVQNVVYVSSSGKIHKVPDCSGMKNYKEMSEEDAVAAGYEWCDNCA